MSLFLLKVLFSNTLFCRQFKIIKMIVQGIVLLLIGVFIGISQSAGIGGGVIINILLIVGLGYNAKQSVIITYIFLMGGGLASTLASLKKTSQNGKRLMDYNLVMITLPMMMSGAIFGIILNNFASELMITMIFIILIFYLSYTTFHKYREVTQKEKAETVEENQSQNQPSVVDTEQAQKLKQMLAQDNSVFPKEKLKIIAQIYLYTFVIAICRGGVTHDSFIGIPSCSLGTWVFAFIHLFISYLFSKIIAITKIQQDLEKENLGYVFQDQKERMTDKKMREGMFNGFMAGILGACAGMGGGMVLVPLWFKSGIDRNVATSSTGPLIFFSSSISFIISAMLDRYDSYVQVALFFVVSFTGSYLIKNLLAYLIEKYNFKALVLVLLLIMMAFSLIALLPSEYHKYSADPQGFMEFGQLC